MFFRIFNQLVLVTRWHKTVSAADFTRTHPAINSRKIATCRLRSGFDAANPFNHGARRLQQLRFGSAAHDGKHVATLANPLQGGFAKAANLHPIGEGGGSTQ